MLFALGLLALAPAAAPFELKDGDRVVWIGSSIAEREQKYGYWETALLCQWPERRITFRNLGWSGDTVEGIARASFDPPTKGYERLIKSVKDEKPTVIFVSYGSVEALDANSDAEKFEKRFEKLLEDLSTTKARIVLFSPTPLEPDGVTGPFGGGMPREETLRAWRMQSHAKSVGHVAERGGYHFADLFTRLQKHQEKKLNEYTFTDNGLHLSEAGYEGTIPDFLSSLGLSWAGEEPKKFEAVRKAVVKKNQLYFNMWRPQNETYLFGFRKPEQGNNAKEVKEFEPLIAAAEDDIRKGLAQSRNDAKEKR
jgi:lysophospholipase L1-like esterase